MNFEKTIWILEDDESCTFVYKDIFEIRFKTSYFSTIHDFSTMLQKEKTPDLVIADLKLPDDNFLNFLSSSNYRKLLNIPFMVISSIHDIDALRYCFKEGALEYLTKPFNKNELLVKIERIFSNNYFSNSQSIQSSSNTNNFDFNKFIDFTKKEMRIFKFFAQAKDYTIDRNVILSSIWGNVSVHPKTLDVHLYNLRKKLVKYNYRIVSIDSGIWKLSSDGMNV